MALLPYRYLLWHYQGAPVDNADGPKLSIAVRGSVAPEDVVFRLVGSADLAGGSGVWDLQPGVRLLGPDDLEGGNIVLAPSINAAGTDRSSLISEDFLTAHIQPVVSVTGADPAGGDVYFYLYSAQELVIRTLA